MVKIQKQHKFALSWFWLSASIKVASHQGSEIWCHGLVPPPKYSWSGRWLPVLNANRFCSTGFWFAWLHGIRRYVRGILCLLPHQSFCGCSCVRACKRERRVRVYEVPRVEDHDRASFWWTRDEFAAALEQAAAHYAKTRNMRNHSLSIVDRTISLAPFVATLIAIILLQQYTWRIVVQGARNARKLSTIYCSPVL